MCTISLLFSFFLNGSCGRHCELLGKRLHHQRSSLSSLVLDLFCAPDSPSSLLLLISRFFPSHGRPSHPLDFLHIEPRDERRLCCEHLIFSLSVGHSLGSSILLPDPLFVSVRDWFCSTKKGERRKCLSYCIYFFFCCQTHYVSNPKCWFLSHPDSTCIPDSIVHHLHD